MDKKQKTTESTELSERIASGEAQLLFKEVKKWRIGKIGEKFKSQLRQEKSDVRKLINCITELGKKYNGEKNITKQAMLQTQLSINVFPFC